MKRKGEGSHGKDIKKGTKLRCLVCGREVTVDKEGRGPLICCMRPMHVIGNVSEGKGSGGGFRGFGPGAQDYYGQDVQGPGEFEDAEDPEKNEKKRKYYWRSEMQLNNYLEKIQEAGWQGMPKGWDKKSIKKFARSLAGGGKKEGFFDKCVKKMQDEKGFNKDRAQRFCAGIKDELYGSTYWRGKDKSPQEVRKDVKRHKNV